MCPFVNLTVIRSGESLVTLRAGVWFISRVNSHVRPQILWLVEGLCTLGAGVGSLASVSFLVCIQATGPGERFVTNVAWEELLSSMGKMVGL